ncbi:type VI secretion protein, partial [Xanthomonas citri pv. citri]|nr:type VI secretion protein [Xanthomonas citri pv. citri]
MHNMLLAHDNDSNLILELSFTPE